MLHHKAPPLHLAVRIHTLITVEDSVGDSIKSDHADGLLVVLEGTNLDWRDSPSKERKRRTLLPLRVLIRVDYYVQAQLCAAYPSICFDLFFRGNPSANRCTFVNSDIAESRPMKLSLSRPMHNNEHMRTPRYLSLVRFAIQ